MPEDIALDHPPHRPRVTMRAWCFRDGVLAFSPTLPSGAMPVAVCTDEEDIEEWQQSIRGWCRHGYTRGIYLIPGIPEAQDEERALEALGTFSALLRGGL